MKIVALDIGDRWTGIAISDQLALFARPYQTVETSHLINSLKIIIQKEQVNTIVVGYPKTLRDTESDQTRKIVVITNELKEQISTINWILWDERLSSKYASQLKKAKTAQEKLQSHAIAAAFILGTYLDHLNFQKVHNNNI